MWMILALATLGDAVKPEPLILAHYMPWYEAKPTSPAFGWHWTMNHFRPEDPDLSKRGLASRFRPLVGPYDSGDPHVIEYQLLTMKAAGIDGVVVDWYGLQPFRDYPTLHRNTVKLVEAIVRLGMKFAICYEDQTIPALVEAGRLRPSERVSHAGRELDWLRANWFGLDAYVKLDGRPVLLSFGQSGLTDAEWSVCLADEKTRPAYFSLHHRRKAAVGAFDWPLPKEGMKAVDRFQVEARPWPASIPVVFPRFVDIYAEAKVGPSYGRIEDRDGATFRETLAKALASGAPIVQIATWNDWGEGTMIEPSAEFGDRDLAWIQRSRSGRPYSAEDLKLPRALLERRRRQTSVESTVGFDAAVSDFAAGRPERLRALLKPKPAGP